MRVYGIFRGFPGLGRVISGISLMTELKKRGHEVKVYSYLQGVDSLKEHGLDFIIENQPTIQQVMAIGLSPICDIAEKIIGIICRDRPELVIIDGEPLMISTLSMVYPRKRIMAILNPTDLYNESLPDSSARFFHHHYLSAGTALVHGISKDMVVIPNDSQGCQIVGMNTILRADVINMNVGTGKRIVAILGGGCSNSSENFFKSTVMMGERIIAASREMPEEKFCVYCNDANVADCINTKYKPDNVKIEHEYVRPEEVYAGAKVVLCRAGRNTISELLYLGIPAILMASNGDFRSVEQEKNIEKTIEMYPGKIIKAGRDDNGVYLAKKIKELIGYTEKRPMFVPGNKTALEVIERVLVAD